jgi:uncharacterized protein YndB with AHSA1/START domain
MPVKKEPSGRRSVQAEIDIAGLPEQVWEAIASGPGISSWFVPTKVDGRVGGTTTSDFGPNMQSAATITTWEPPMRFVAESGDNPALGTVATEWTVEAKAGGVCTVRVVHSWFASNDDWDDQFEGHSHGWRAFFQILRLYVQHFAGQPCELVQFLATSPEANEQAWDALIRPLGLTTAKIGERITTSDGAMELSGVAEAINPPEWPGMILRLDQPAPAIAHLFAMPMGGQTILSVRFYLYGDSGGNIVERIRQGWGDWLSRTFPSAG